MPYTSVFPQMKARADKENQDYWKIRTYYTERLTMIQSNESTVPLMTPDAQQHRAENQTWAYFWPEDSFPGTDPQPNLWTPGAEHHSPGAGGSDVSRPTSSSAEPSFPNLQSQQNASQDGSDQALQSRGAISISPQTNSSSDGASRALLGTEAVYSLWICGSCQEPGHTLADCTRELDSQGFLTGCPKCNTKDHNYDDCQDILQQHDRVRDYHFLIFRRIGKPPIRSRIKIESLGNGRISKLDGMPQKSEFARARMCRSLLQDPNEMIMDPSWDPLKIIEGYSVFSQHNGVPAPRVMGFPPGYNGKQHQAPTHPPNVVESVFQNSAVPNPFQQPQQHPPLYNAPHRQPNFQYGSRYLVSTQQSNSQNGSMYTDSTQQPDSQNRTTYPIPIQRSKSQNGIMYPGFTEQSNSQPSTKHPSPVVHEVYSRPESMLQSGAAPAM